MEFAAECCDGLIDNVFDYLAYQEQAKKIGPFATEYILQSNTITFKGMSTNKDEKTDDKYLAMEGSEEPVPGRIDSLMNDLIKTDLKRAVMFTATPLKAVKKTKHKLHAKSSSRRTN